MSAARPAWRRLLARFSPVVAVLVLFAALAGPATSGAAAVSSSTPVTTLVRQSVTVDAVRRTYLLAVPSGTPRRAPLVIALHGLHGTARWMALQTGLLTEATERHVVLVTPDSLGPAWNDGRLGPHGPADQRFIVALIGQLARRGVVDPHRVVLTGFSNGAEMSLVMAARHPQIFAGVVAVSGRLLAGPVAARPAGPVNLWLVQGTQDPVQPLDGRPFRSRLLPGLQSAAQTAAAFVRVNGDPAHPTWQSRAGGRQATGPLSVATYRGKRSGASVTVVTVPGGRHAWPVASAAHAGPSRELVGFSASGLVMQLAATSRA